MRTFSRFAQRFHVLLNIGLILSALLLAGVIVNKYFRSRSDSIEASAFEGIKLGSKLDVRDVDWTKNNQTLVLVLSSKCHVCSESADFYRRILAAGAEPPRFRTMALFSESVLEAQQYLKTLNLSINEVRQVPLVMLGFKGTPTLLIVDGYGQVTRIWLGKLTDTQEQEVLRRIQVPEENAVITADVASAEHLVTSEQFSQMVKAGRSITVVDVGERADYARGHVEGAKNIPIDEIEVRAVNELSPDDFILTSCQCVDTSLSNLAREKLIKSGFKNVKVLR